MTNNETTTTTQKTPHKDIRIEFQVGGRKYEAVGFLRPGETSVTGITMIERTNGKGTVVGEEDWNFLWEHRQKFPENLRPYHLATKRHYPDGPRTISCFGWSRSEWHEYWGHQSSQWDGFDLVLRRRT